TVKIVGFIRRGHLYEKFSETHVEQSYSEEQIYRLLEGAGFWVEGEYHCFSFEPPVRDTNRIMWVARLRKN
ncbi:MAG: class I SAM-dependent methyltransferase, partial [Chloroflexi bacterium]|nr:class I SAM-dependent methyltransferase [Chloroflexota bacterium]